MGLFLGSQSRCGCYTDCFYKSVLQRVKAEYCGLSTERSFLEFDKEQAEAAMIQHFLVSVVGNMV